MLMVLMMTPFQLLLDCTWAPCLAESPSAGGGRSTAHPPPALLAGDLAPHCHQLVRCLAVPLPLSLTQRALYFSLLGVFELLVERCSVLCPSARSLDKVLVESSRLSEMLSLLDRWGQFFSEVPAFSGEVIGLIIAVLVLLGGAASLDVGHRGVCFALPYVDVFGPNVFHHIPYFPPLPGRRMARVRACGPTCFPPGHYSSIVRVYCYVANGMFESMVHSH